MGLARGGARVQAGPRASAQLRRRVLLLQPLSGLTPPPRRGRRPARPGGGAGPALPSPAGEPGPAGLLRRGLRRRRGPAPRGAPARLDRRAGPVGAGAGGGAAGAGGRCDRPAGADQRRQSQPEGVARPRLCARGAERTGPKGPRGAARGGRRELRAVVLPRAGARRPGRA